MTSHSTVLEAGAGLQKPGMRRSDRAAETAPDELQGEFSNVVRTAIEFMNNDLARPITLRDLSELTDCSPGQIIRAFRKSVGITPHAWLIRRRVLQGRFLIELGVSIANAASEVGFFDQTHFTRHFKKLHGYTPARYRDSLWREVHAVADRSGKDTVGRRRAGQPQ